MFSGKKIAIALRRSPLLKRCRRSMRPGDRDCAPECGYRECACARLFPSISAPRGRSGHTMHLRTRHRCSPPLARQVPHTERQSHCAKTVSQHSRLAAMNLPALPKGNGGCKKHHNASKVIHARILSAPPAHFATAATILNAAAPDRPFRPAVLS